MEPRTVTVEEDAAAPAPRLEAFVLAALSGWSRRLVRQLIADGAVRVNGRRAAKGLRLRAGDRVTLPALPATLAPQPELALPIVHEDAALVAVDKPGGMPAHALDPRDRDTAAAFLLARYPEMAVVGDRLAPGLVHRLDTGTSGLLLAARTPEAHAAVRDALRARQVEKRYVAVVAGDARELDAATIAEPLAHDPGDRRRMTAACGDVRAWPAETRVVVRTPGAERSLVEVVIRTGVTHQVRVHLALRGHPVVNDVLYGGPVEPSLAGGRHALHAARLALAHPADGRPLVLEVPVPDELRALVS